MIRPHWPPDRSKTSCDQELLSELVDSLIIQQTSCYWGLLSELIRAWSSNKLLVIAGSYQSLFPPWLIRVSLRSGARIRAQWLKNWSTTLFWSGALARAHWLFVEQQEGLPTHSYWKSRFLRLVALLRANIISGSPTEFLRPGALIRAHWLPNRSKLRSGALLRAHWLPDRQTNFLRSGALIRAHWLPDRPKIVFWSGALIRAHWHSDQQTILSLLEARLVGIESLVNQ